MNLNIETLVAWSEGKQVATRNGDRLLRKAKATEAFWVAWRSGKEVLKAAGVSCAPVNRNDPRGAWEACWWLPVTAPVPGAPVAAAAVAKPTGLSDEQKARLVNVTSKLLPYQVASVSDAALALAVHGGELDASDTGCHAKGTMILMADGTIEKVENISVGDSVMGWDSTPRKVIRLARGKEKMVKIVPSKGESFIVNESHKLTLQFTDASLFSGMGKRSGTVIDITVKDYMKLCKTHKHCLKLFRTGINLKPQKQVLPAYLIGILLGDGHMVQRVSVTTADKEIEDYCRSVAEENKALVIKRAAGERCPEYVFTGFPLLFSELRRLGLFGKKSGTKFIPDEYKLGDRKQRLEMLAALLDTDGSRCSADGYDYISKSKRLADDVVFVARSLGYAAYVRPTYNYCQTGNGGLYHRVSISGVTQELPIKISRKKPLVRVQKKSVLRTGFQVEMLKEDNFYGFSITGDGRFCMGDFTVTHNTGKTYVSIAASIVLGQPLYVVCPIAVIPSWNNAGKHFGVKFAGICNYELLKRGNLPELSIVKVKDGRGKEVDQFQWNLPLNTVIAFDECARLKDSKTQNNAMGMAALRQGYKVIGISATAADNPMQMKFASRLTSQVASDKSFFSWMLRHGVIRGRFGLEFNGSKQVLEKIHHDIFPSHGTRIKIDDLGDAFPETQIGNEYINLNGQSAEIDRIYQEMEAEIAKIEESEMEDKGACILTVRLRARQRAEVLKVPAVAAYVQDKIAEGMSVALFVNFDATLDAIGAKLGTKCVIRGGQKPEEREANIQAFQADKEPVILCNIKAGGVGVSLHGNKNSRMRFSGIFPSDSAQDVKQALGRCWRAGGAKSIQRIFIASGTIEEAVYGNAIEKIGRIDMLNNGDGSAKPAPAPVAESPQPQYVASVEIADPVAKSAVAVPGSVPVAAAPEVSEELRQLVSWACQVLSGLDPDHAGVINGVGWNGTDGNFGHSLAERSYLSPKQVLCGAKMIRKYHGQLGGESFLAKLDAAMPKK